jgi:hypothetical protein
VTVSLGLFCPSGSAVERFTATLSSSNSLTDINSQPLTIAKVPGHSEVRSGLLSTFFRASAWASDGIISKHQAAILQPTTLETRAGDRAYPRPEGDPSPLRMGLSPEQALGTLDLASVV